MKRQTKKQKRDAKRAAETLLVKRRAARALKVKK